MYQILLTKFFYFMKKFISMMLLLMITFVAAWAEQPKQILPITTATDVGWYQQCNSVNTITLPGALIVEQNKITLLETEQLSYQYLCQINLAVPEVALNLKYPLNNINTNDCIYSVASGVDVCINNTRQNFGGDKQNGDSII